MRKNLILSLALFAGLFLFIQPVFAATFTVSGRVATTPPDQKGEGIPGALIQFSPHGNNPPYPGYVTVSNFDGYFSIAIPGNGEPGFHYHIFVTAQGYSFYDDLTYEQDGFFYFAATN